MSHEGKDLISNKHKNCVVYTFQYFSSNNYIGQTFRHLETRIKEYIPKCVRDYTNNQPKTTGIATSNAMNRSLISEFLNINPIFGKSYNETKFRLFRLCNNIFDSIKIEDIYIHLNEPKSSSRNILIICYSYLVS